MVEMQAPLLSGTPPAKISQKFSSAKISYSQAFKGILERAQVSQTSSQAYQGKVNQSQPKYADISSRIVKQLQNLEQVASSLPTVTPTEQDAAQVNDLLENNPEAITDEAVYQAVFQSIAELFQTSADGTTGAVKLDMEVKHVVFPTDLLTQDEFKSLIAQVMGLEENDGFLSIWDTFAGADSETGITSADDVMDTLEKFVDLIQSLSDEDISGLAVNPMSMVNPQNQAIQITTIKITTITMTTRTDSQPSGMEYIGLTDVSNTLPDGTQLPTDGIGVNPSPIENEAAAEAINAVREQMANELDQIALPTAKPAGETAETAEVPQTPTDIKSFLLSRLDMIVVEPEVAPETLDQNAPLPEQQLTADTVLTEMTEPVQQSADTAAAETPDTVQQMKTDTLSADADAEEPVQQAKGDTSITVDSASSDTSSNTSSDTADEGSSQDKDSKNGKFNPFDSSAVQNAQQNSSRTVFDQPSTQEAPAKQPTTAAQIADRLIQSAALHKGEGVTKLELQLSPEYLGKMSVIIESTKEGIKATLKPANDTVRNLMAGQMTELQNALKDMGINMKSISIEQPDVAWDFSRGSFDQQQGNGSPQSYQDGKSGKRSLNRINTNQIIESRITNLVYGNNALAPEKLDDTGFDLRA